WIWRADLGKHCKLTIAVNKLHWNVEPHQESERFIRHRTRENVAADYDLIDSRTTHILENSLQRRKVSMNVAECRNSHLTPQLFNSSHKAVIRRTIRDNRRAASKSEFCKRPDGASGSSRC